MSKTPMPGLDNLAQFRKRDPEPEGKAARPTGRDIAQSHGFVERDLSATVPRKRSRAPQVPTASFTARLSVPAINDFVDWCERERMSYREAFDKLADHIPKS